MENMQKIIGYGTFGAATLYVITGVFGYAAFAAYRGDSYPLIKGSNPPEYWTFEKIFEL
jgi:hypothetical protein